MFCGVASGLHSALKGCELLLRSDGVFRRCIANSAVPDTNASLAELLPSSSINYSEWRVEL